MNKKDWTYKKLTDICEIQYGYAFDSKCFTDNEEFIPLVRIRDVVKGYSDTFYNGYIPDGYYVEKGDYLIGMDGEFNIARWNSRTALLNQRVCKVICKDSKNELRYLYYYLKLCLKEIEDETPFVTVKHLSAKRLNLISIPVPPLPTQRAIVAELDTLNEILDKKRQQLKELDTLAQSIFYDMFGDPVENEKGWEVKKMEKVAPVSEYKGEHPDRGGKFWLLNLDKVEAQTGHILNVDYYNPDEIGNSVISFDETNVLYSKLRPYLNKVVIPEQIGYATSELVPLKPQSDILNRYYLAYMLRSKAFVSYINIKVAGAKMPRVSMGTFRDFSVPIPPLSLQQSFAQKIEAIEKQNGLINASIKEVETLLNATMDKYFG